MAKRIEVILEGYVPWQVCPLCNGSGVLAGVLCDVGSVPAVYYGEGVCGVCNGRKVIPMAKVDEGYVDMDALMRVL
jgi:hypothetical protein